MAQDVRRWVSSSLLRSSSPTVEGWNISGREAAMATTQCCGEENGAREMEKHGKENGSGRNHARVWI
jgi:hypothetical protein